MHFLKTTRVVRLGLTALLFAGLLATVASTTPANADVIDSFDIVYQTQNNGSVYVTGNSNLVCATNVTQCQNARNSVTTGSDVNTLNNNNNRMYLQDVDTDTSTVNSSAATFTLPPSGAVLFAGLYWGAAQNAGTGGGNASTVVPARAANQIKFKVPGASSYTTMTADVINNQSDTNKDYAAYKNVTTQVKAAGSGQYWAADLFAATGDDRYGAWSLVVVVRDPSAPLRDLTVFNGYASIRQNESVETSISGFLTPPNGAVNAKIGAVVYEGDAGLLGDYFQVNSTKLSDGQSPPTNFFDSRITRDASNLTDRNPAPLNNMGIDAKVIDATGAIPNSATSASLKFSTDGDVYFPQVLTTQVDLYSPRINGSKTVTNLNGNTPAKVGDVLEYALTFSNTGDDNATKAIVSDDIPANTTYVPGSLAISAGTGTGAKTDKAGDDLGEYSAATNAITMRVGSGASSSAGGTLNKNDTVTVKYRTRVDLSAAGTTIPNTASLSYTAQTINKSYVYTSNETQTPVGALADVHIEKTASPEPVRAGENVTYTLQVTNAGPNTAAATQVLDTLPTGLSFVSAAPTTGTCANTAQTITCDLGDVANGATPSITVVARAASALTASNITNVATVSATTSDQDPSNNSAAAASSVTTAADLALTKTASPNNPTPGTDVTYTLTLRNNGPSDALNVSLDDVLPTAFTTATATADTGTCTVTGGSVHCETPKLVAGQTLTATVVARLNPAYSGGALRNDAKATSSTLDPTPSNNAATATVTPSGPRADLVTTKQTLTSPVVAGQPVDYRITVKNNGPSTASGVHVLDTLPATITGITATPTQGTCTITGQAVDCNADTLAPPSSVTVVVHGTLAATATGTLANSASATTSGSDPSPANNAATTTDAITRKADVSITKTGTPNPALGGQTITYTMVVSNDGPSSAENTVVTDPVVDPLDYVAGSCTPSCSFANNTVTWQLGSLAPNATATLTFKAAIPGNVVLPDITNRATVTSATPDPDTSDNTASFRNSLGNLADLRVTKAGAPGTVRAGEAITYTITVSNAGPSIAVNSVVTDTVPSSIDVTDVSSSTGGTCPADVNAVRCTRAALASGQTWTITIKGTVKPDTNAGPLANTAKVDAATPDPTDSNNTDTVTSTVVSVADLTVKDSGPATVVAGTNATYTLTATNNGPATAKNVIVTDELPPGGTFVSGGGDGVTCALQAGSTSVVECVIGSLAPGSSKTIPIVVAIDPDTPNAAVIPNNASASSTTSDPNLANNADSVTSTVNKRADLSIAKSVDSDPLVPGRNATYTLVAHDEGPSTADAARVVDTLPAELRVVSVTQSAGDCSTSGQTVTCTRASFPPKSDWTINIEVTVASSASGDITNRATVSSPTTDPGSDANAATVTTSARPTADVEVIETVDPNPVVAGQIATYTMTVVNHGPSDARSVVFDTTLPDTLTIDAVTGTDACTVSGRSIHCDFGTLGSGSDVSFIVTAVVNPSAIGSITNTATVKTSTTDPVAENNTDAVSTPIIAIADLDLQKTADPETVVPGNAFTYALAVTNNGPSSARDVTVTDQMPTGVTVLAASIQGVRDVTCPVTDNTVTCAVGDLAPGRALVIIDVRLDATYNASTLPNSATVRSSTVDPAVANNTDTINSTVVPLADLEFTKTVSPSPATAGTPVTYTLTVVNAGPSVARNVVVSDTIDAALLNPVGVTNEQPPGTCSLTGTTMNCPLLDLAPGRSAVVTISAVIDPEFTGDLANTADVSADTRDPDPGDNQATVTTNVKDAADVAVTNNADKTPAVPGQPVTYTVVVSNNGPSTARTVTLTNTLSPSLDLSSATFSAGGQTCDIGPDNTITCALGNVAAGASQTITIVGTVKPNATGTLDSDAHAATTTADTNPANNDAANQVPLDPRANLTVTKTRATDPVVPGRPVTYVIATTNNGPSTATNTIVTDTLPAALRQATATGGDCDVTDNRVRCAIGTLDPGDTKTVMVTADLAADFTGTLRNTATATSDTSDPTATNNAATADAGVTPQADVVVTQEASPRPVVAGEQVTFTIHVRNDGPSTANSVTLNDDLLDTLTNLVANGAGCSVASGNKVTCNLGNLTPGQSVDVTITATVPAGQQDPISNTATATTTTPDPNELNNTATASTDTRPLADLKLSKAVVTDPVVPGQPVSFTITATNAGSSNATNVVITDPLPTQLQDATAVLVGNDDSASNCAVTNNTVTCPVGTLAPGQSAKATVTALVKDYATGTLTNTATVKSATEDLNPNDGTDTTSTPLAPSADLALTKTLAPTPPVPGQTVAFTLTATNAGPSTAKNVTITDTLPAVLTDVTATADDADCNVEGNKVTCTFANLSVGAPASVVVQANVPDDFKGTIKNNASVTSDTPDPNRSNNDASASGAAAPHADLSITKSLEPTAPIPGRPVTFTLRVHNAGPNAAHDVVVTDELPAAITNASATAADDGDCALTDATVTCSLDRLANAANATFTITGTLAADFTGVLTNTATVRAATDDPDPSNNTGTATGGAVGDADLHATKVSSTATPKAGDLITYTVTVGNDGPAPARNVVLDDVMPKGLSLVGATTATQGTCNVTDATKLHCDLGTLRAGTVASITYSARIAADAKGTVVNKAVVKSDTDDRNPIDNEGTRPIDIAQPVQVSDTPPVTNPSGQGPSGMARTGLGHLTLVLLQAGIALLVSGTLLYEISRLGPEDDSPA